ncbi:transcriptional regulator [Paracidovorax avenae]|uniref:helix-turn-helix transcriptional regulator n=1 Tax=Paracidovorax avenae TaxID=80867 RepID=UPI000D2163D5|nr:helix-turn-helix transcriptional regulator [Paracidovorax avenae]AVS66363.1 transcriptional regulator [Paracidovorax avenae]
MPRQNTRPADYPQAVLQQIGQLAENIATARKRRGETQAQWARKLGVSQPTMARIERGDPSVAMASYVMCLWLINQAQGLADLAAPAHDRAALEREVARARSRGPASRPRDGREPARLRVPRASGPLPAFGVSEPGPDAASQAAGLAALLHPTKLPSE